MRNSSRSETLAPEKVITTAGSGLGLSSDTMGSLVSCGNSAFARSTASRTSAKACLILSPTSNSAVIITAPSRAVALTSSSPSKILSSFSIGLINNRAPSSGEIPSCRTIIMTTGNVTLGLSSTGIERREPAPATSTNNIMARVARACSTISLKKLM